MRFRKLRIAWSVVCGLACVATIVLWVRSYSYWDELYNPITNQTLIIVESASGRAILDATQTSPGAPWMWHISAKLSGNYWEGPLDDVHAANREKGFAGFAYYANPWHKIVRAPFWFFVLLLAMLAAAPWLRWSKRFSLRTLLIATTLVAVVLGLIVYVVRS